MRILSLRGRSCPPASLVLLLLGGLLLLPGVLFAQAPLAFQGVGVSNQMLANGNVLVRFTVRVQIFITPMVFNYHWERSDGAQSGVQMWAVQPGTTSIPVTTTWELGPSAAVGEVWEKLVINTGNTHIESEPVRITLSQPAPQGDPIAILRAGAGYQMLPNGNTKVTFSVRVVANRTPLGFNYHWERSDGAQSRMEMMTVQPGTTEFNISTTWELGPAAAVGEIWEKLFINTGNTHLESQPVRFVFR